MIRRVDPRRPALITPQGLRRIVLGGTEGERDLRLASAHAATVRQPRLPETRGRVDRCLLVLTHPDSGSLDEHAREAVAAAALLARADEAVVLLMPWDGEAPPPIDAAALGIDRLELLPCPATASAGALAEAVAERWQALAPRLLLLPDRGPDADLGRRLAAALRLTVAAPVVEIAAGRARVRDLGDVGRVAGDGTAALEALQVLLLGRQVARTELPFLGRGELQWLAPVDDRAWPGLHDQGVVAGRAQQVALEEADFILAAGNGVTDVPLFLELAEALGAAVGASRVAVDDGRFARSQQIGATGRTVQARGYLAMGISGAVQHLQGIRECRHVIAVNTDVSAPMVQRAELTVAEDVQALMRALLKLLREPSSSSTPVAAAPVAALPSVPALKAA